MRGYLHKIMSSLHDPVYCTFSEAVIGCGYRSHPGIILKPPPPTRSVHKARDPSLLEMAQNNQGHAPSLTDRQPLILSCQQGPKKEAALQSEFVNSRGSGSRHVARVGWLLEC